MDRHGADLASERPAQRVADRGIDLAGHLGDGQPVGDRHADVDGHLGPEGDADRPAAKADPVEERLARAR